MLTSTTNISDEELAQRLEQEELRLANGISVVEPTTLTDISIQDVYQPAQMTNQNPLSEGQRETTSFSFLNTLRLTSKENGKNDSSNSAVRNEDRLSNDNDIDFEGQSMNRGRSHFGTADRSYTPLPHNGLNNSQEVSNIGMISNFFPNLFGFSRLNDSNDNNRNAMELESGGRNMNNMNENQNVYTNNDRWRIVPAIPDADRDSILLMTYKLANAVKILVVIDACFLFLNCLFLSPLFLLFLWGPFSGFIASTKFKINYAKVYLGYYLCKLLFDLILVFAGFFFSIFTFVITFMIARYIYIYYKLLNTCSKSEVDLLRTNGKTQLI